jgi:uncharacterized membrane protein
MKRTATWLLLLLTAGAVWHMVHYYPLLPETVGSHYGASGEPDGWSSKQTFVALYAVLVALIGGMFFVLAVFIPRIPDSLINIPHRDYWLAPERRRQSLATVSVTLLCLASATVALIIGAMHLSFLVNLGERSGLGAEFWWLMGAYGLLTLGSVVWMMARFRKPFP